VIFTPTEVSGVFSIELERQHDERGWFARTYSTDEFARRGIDFTALECSASFNASRGTLRGLHFQAEPGAEPKLVRCTRGVMYDVAVDLRSSSKTYRAWTAVELSADRGNALFVPTGCAHGFLTLEDATEVLYTIGARFQPELARGVRWDDPAFAIEWPFPPTVISERDAFYPDYEAQRT
jgi:dTDP-4-dehydrorhamnose 3,5-epimerase